jgi:hypothetical protein
VIRDYKDQELAPDYVGTRGWIIVNIAGIKEYKIYPLA